jgi:hypothetical protein
LFEHGRRAADAGLSMTVHAIGDRANHEVLDAYEHLRAYEMENGLPHLRHRIEHVQILHPDDVSRLAGLSVIASMQPIHAPSDMPVADRYWGERSALAYAWRSSSNRCAFAFGRMPRLIAHPFLGRMPSPAADGSPACGLVSEQKSLWEALKLGPAYAAMRVCLCQLTPGYLLTGQGNDPLPVT